VTGSVSSRRFPENVEKSYAALDTMNIIVIFLVHGMGCVRRHESSDKSSPAPTVRHERVRTHFLTGRLLSNQSKTANERLTAVLPLSVEMSDMQYQADWLTRFMELVTVTGKLTRCALGAPWAIEYSPAGTQEMQYHVVLTGRALLENSDNGATYELRAGDIALLPHGSAHVLHDGSGAAPVPSRVRDSGGLLVKENSGAGEALDMLCGRFVVAPPHDRLIRSYLPSELVVRTEDIGIAAQSLPQAERLSRLVALMRAEAMDNEVGSGAILNALSSALFALTLRAAVEAGQARTGVLALAAHPRLSPAATAIFNDPARAWTLPELAGLCSMSRATFQRHFQARLGRSAMDLLIDIRMSAAANALRKSTSSTEAVADLVGYQSVSAFRRVFAQRMGVTPGDWRQRALKDGAPHLSDDEADGAGERDRAGE
jgi:AraC family transcriptional activator of mtrCDE